MKRILITVLFAVVASFGLRAQEYRVETLGSASVDSTLVGRNILSLLGSGVVVNQSVAMRTALDRYISDNAAKKLTGYRVRVFFDNGKDARGRSEAIARSISTTYPGIGVYRTFESPNFKVSVGDFRTKDEALKVYQSLKASYPTALLLKETINYPR